MNSAAIQLPVGPLADPNLVRLLEDMLSKARSGELMGAGVVAVMSGGGLQCAALGPEALVYLGWDQLKAAILAQMQGKRSSISPARGG